MNIIDIGMGVKREREIRGMSRKKLARKAHVQPKILKAWEEGYIRDISINDVLCILQGLGMTLQITKNGKSLPDFVKKEG